MPCGGGWGHDPPAAHTCPSKGSGLAGEAGQGRGGRNLGHEGEMQPGEGVQSSSEVALGPEERPRVPAACPGLISQSSAHTCVSRRRAHCSGWRGLARRLRGSSFPLLTPRARGGPAPSHVRRPRRRPTRSPCARSTAASCCKPTATRTCTTGCTPSTRSWPGPYGTRLHLHGPPCSGWGEGGRSEDVRLLLGLLLLVTCVNPGDVQGVCPLGGGRLCS